MQKKRRRAKRGTAASKWVACVSCGHEYYIEPYEGRPECPVCESREYEDVDVYPLLSMEDDSNDW